MVTVVTYYNALACINGWNMQVVQATELLLQRPVAEGRRPTALTDTVAFQNSTSAIYSLLLKIAQVLLALTAHQRRM